MTRSEAFAEINQIQDSYINELIALIDNPNYVAMKTIDFTSPTGTGKTKMMSKLINKFPDYYFIITTLSKGQLHLQIRENLKQDCNQNNFYVYGSADYKINSKLDAEDIIGRIPANTKCIWLRDEGHIKTNRFDALLLNVCYKVVNFSATNMHSDIQCNFTQTMMLRTVNQTNGTPEDAIEKLLEIKQIHKNVPAYNPCAIFRCVGGDNDLYKRIVELCEKNNLKYIDITENSFNMAELCEDDNKFDVIINKFKIVEGIDIRRAHVLYMDNQPANNATTIQVIGRCRRNALLYRNDIDILAPENAELLKATRECYVYYNVQNMKIDSDADGELYYAFCDKISCESLKAGMTIHVENGQLPNGLHVLELEGCTGNFAIDFDPSTGFNIVMPLTSFYDTCEKKFNEYLYSSNTILNAKTHEWQRIYSKIHIDDVPKLTLQNKKTKYDYGLSQSTEVSCESYYRISSSEYFHDTVFPGSVTDYVLKHFDEKVNKNGDAALKKLLTGIRIEDILQKYVPNISDSSLDNTIQKYRNKKNWKIYFQNDALRFETYTIESISSESYELKSIADIIDDTSQKYLLYCCLQYIKQHEQYWDDWCFKSLRKRVEDACSLILLLKMEKNNKLNKSVIYNIFSGNIVYNCICQSKNDILARFHQHMKIKICKRGRGEFSFEEPVLLDDVAVKIADINAYFASIPNLVYRIKTIGFSMKDVVTIISEGIKETRDHLQHQIIDEVYLSFANLFEPVTQDEADALTNGELHVTSRITKSAFNRYITYRHDKIVNDRESAIVGVDMMKPIKIENTMYWTESRAITSKAGSYNKLNGFLSLKYSDELIQAKSQCFTGKNSFKLDKKCNSALGYCVEYYSKYVVYGESYLEEYIEAALRESKMETVNSSIIVRACMLKYKDMMVRSFGQAMSKIIRTMSVTTLLQENYEYFVNLVVALGTQTAKFVSETLYSDRDAIDNVDPDLSIRHIAGLADYITTDTILDIKVRNNIDDKCVRQVLGYHYLSTKRSDLFIKKVIIYDAVSSKSVVIDITDKNLIKGYDYEEK